MYPQPSGHAQPNRYRIRLFNKKNREEFDGQPPIAQVLDFSPGPGLRATEGQLDGLVQSLAWRAGARGREALNYYLVVTDWATDANPLQWPAKTWFEDE